jgi:hypothetical protein
MKVGIATFHWADNYGAILQAYALQTFLSEKGHEVHILNYNPFRNEFKFKNYIGKTPKSFILKWEHIYNKYLFKQFRRKYLNISTICLNSHEDFAILANMYDLIIVGSDQVWNPIWLDQQCDMWQFYFLDFPENKSKIISYAASFGQSQLASFNEEWQEKLKKYMARFDSISVREESGRIIANSFSNKNNAICVLDPTLLLDSTKYNLFFKRKINIRKYVFTYLLHGYDSSNDVIEKQVCSYLSLDIIKCNAKNSFFYKNYLFPKPEDWLKLIYDASFVVTNSYHGMVFCLIFKVPFMVQLLDGEYESMNSRLIELLQITKLTSRIYNAQDNNINKICDEKINWIVVDEELSKMKILSIEYLNRNL